MWSRRGGGRGMVGGGGSIGGCGEERIERKIRGMVRGGRAKGVWTVALLLYGGAQRLWVRYGVAF